MAKSAEEAKIRQLNGDLMIGAPLALMATAEEAKKADALTLTAADGNTKYIERLPKDGDPQTVIFHTKGDPRYFQCVYRTPPTEENKHFRASAWIETKDLEGNQRKTNDVYFCFPGYGGDPIKLFLTRPDAESKEVWKVKTEAVPFAEKELKQFVSQFVSGTMGELEKKYSIGAGNCTAVFIGHSTGCQATQVARSCFNNYHFGNDSRTVLFEQFAAPVAKNKIVTPIQAQQATSAVGNVLAGGWGNTGIAAAQLQGAQNDAKKPDSVESSPLSVVRDPNLTVVGGDPRNNATLGEVFSIDTHTDFVHAHSIRAMVQAAINGEQIVHKPPKPSPIAGTVEDVAAAAGNWLNKNGLSVALGGIGGLVGLLMGGASLTGLVLAGCLGAGSYFASSYFTNAKGAAGPLPNLTLSSISGNVRAPAAGGNLDVALQQFLNGNNTLNRNGNTKPVPQAVRAPTVSSPGRQ